MAGSSDRAFREEQRTLAAIVAVLPPGTEFETGVPIAPGSDRRFDLVTKDAVFEIKRVARGWPTDVARVVAAASQLEDLVARSNLAGHAQPRLVVVAPEMSSGARDWLDRHGISWVDETGAAHLAAGSLIVARDSATDVAARATTRPVRHSLGESGSAVSSGTVSSGTARGAISWRGMASGSAGSPTDRADAGQQSLGWGVGQWRVATLAVAEALLLGTRPTQAAVQQATGLSAGTASRALAQMAEVGLLSSDVGRGPMSGRRLEDAQALLTAYVAAEQRLTAKYELRVGVLWRDPITSAAHLIAALPHHLRSGAMATGSLAAAATAPYLGEVTVSEIYLPVTSPAELHAAAAAAGLKPSVGGRLLLRSSPGRGTERLADTLVPPIDTDQVGSPTPVSDSEPDGVSAGLPCAPWPRVFADLRRIGVRGEEAANELLSAVNDPTRPGRAMDQALTPADPYTDPETDPSRS